MTFFVRFTEGVIGTPSHRFYRKNKKGGGYRLIGVPNAAMAEVQKKLLNFLRAIAPRCYSASSGKGSIGAVKNARSHKGSWYLFKVDFSHAFESTPGVALASMVARRAKKHIPVGIPVPTASEWHEFLLRYALTARGGLIQGAHTSPLLLDWYCEEALDKPLRRLLHFWKKWPSLCITVRYTRYVDDLSFSCRHKISRGMRREIRHIIAEAGYLENHRKTEVAELFRHGTVRITGVQIGGGGHLGLARKEVKGIERMLDTALTMPLFSEKPEVIDGKVRYLLDVTRGKERLNALEARTLRLYVQWCSQTGENPAWASKVLKRKWEKPQTDSRKL